METMTLLPPWSISYRYDVEPSQVRTSARGRQSQDRRSHRNIVVADATRRLVLSQLPYFEFFVRGMLNDGKDKFIDYYADYNGLQTGTIRLVDGAYSVSTDTITHIVTCQIEVFRG